MTVTTTNSRISYIGDGTSVAFPFPYYFLASTDITVFLSSVEQAGGFTVTGAGNAQGGTVTFTTPPGAGVSILLVRDPDLLQSTDLPPNDPFPSDAVEKALDKLTMIAQAISANESRSVHFPLSETFDGELPLAGDRANKMYGFDANGFPTVLPMPSSLGAGDLRWENGSDGTRGFKTGVDFTPNVTAQITLSRSPINEANVWVYWDGVEQTDFSITGGNRINFPTAIPSGISVVNVRVGTTLSLNIPAQQSVGEDQLQDGAVTDAKISPTSNVAIVINATPTLKRFGAKGDGMTDDTAKILNAFASGELLILGDAGDYIFNATIPITLDGFTFRGRASRRAVRFISQNGNLPAFSVGDSLTGVELSSFTVSRTPAAVSGGDGVKWLGSNSQGLLSNIRVENCWRGFALGPTDYSKIEKCVAQQNYSYGFHVTNVGLNGPCQWSLDNCLSQNNNSHGLFVDASTGSGGALSLGEINCFSTFANTGKGIAVIGAPSNPINGLRILGGFIGGDADDEIYLDTYGGQHKIIGVELELSGFSATGRNNATPATHLGHGISISANNERTQISDPNINGTSLSGIATFGSVTSISNPHITNCGVAAVASDRNGVLAGGGRTMIVGGYIADTGQASQQYGVSSGVGTTVHITGTDMTGNTVAATVGSGTIVTSNCLP